METLEAKLWYRQPGDAQPLGRPALDGSALRMYPFEVSSDKGVSRVLPFGKLCGKFTTTFTRENNGR